ncbi:CHASE3 domain-containing protein [Thauera sinica]|uniref:histidine kinase n=1 Tax=Thauera sinica TaxID=2665146 RepID=A0ABW1ARV4_9RHOO|nr:CHASE3 domain-containing protein [Thauera sp. K11]ATE62202.1 histidine kinase [Thauera sp. K11]
MPPEPSHPPRLRRALPLLLAASLILGLAWLASSQWQSTSSRAALERLRTDAERVHHLDTLLLQLLDAESSVRGYLLSRDPAYLGRYRDGHARVVETLGALRADDWHGEAQRARLAELAARIDGKLAALARGVEQGQGGQGANPGAEAPADGPGKQAMDDIRRIADALRGAALAEIDQSLETSLARFGSVHRLNLVLGAGVLALLLALLVALYRQSLLREQLAGMLHSENERLHAEVEQRTTELSSLATYLTDTREREQARLARELHDELGALMTAAKLDAGWIARKLPAAVMEPLRERFDRLLDTLNQGIAIKRKVVNDLRPPLLADLGLVEALRSLADSAAIGDHDGRLDLDLPEQAPELPADTALALFRIAQEALTNVRRHARATRATLAMRVEPGAIVLRIADDGVGFDPARLGRARHGLAGIAHRVQMLSGRLRVDSAPGRGTVIEARIPRPA